MVSTLKVLVFSMHNAANPVLYGGAQVAKRNLQLLQYCYGMENVEICNFLYPKPEGKVAEHIVVFKRSEPKWDALLAALQGYKIMYPNDMPKILQMVEQVKPDVIFFDGSVYGKLAKKLHNSGICMIAFFHNVEHDYTWEKVKHQGPAYLPSFWAARYNEKLVAQYADIILALNDRDKRRIEMLYGRNIDMLLPIAAEDRFEEEKLIEYTDVNRLLFCGSDFPPNLDAVQWFIKDILPLLPGFALDIVGYKFENRRKELEQDNVRVIGTVERLDDYMYRYPAVIMPIRYGAGMKVKTGEAMMFGRTIFATDEALEGYEVEGVEGIFRCNTAQEFAKSIGDFFSQKPICKFQPAVRKLFLDKYEAENQKKLFADFLTSRGLDKPNEKD